MSCEMAIQVSGVSKSFPVYGKPMHRLYQMFSPRSRKHHWFQQFDALKNIDLSISKGETLGIVGRNGSGKSTLLQVICGTLEPSVGSVEVNGRVAALLELGAGFNPEFTGRENVLMYGTVLGLTRKQVIERFEDIAEFADIGDFMDQPVKCYSSGMYVRLAFAVAIHVTPDILVIDEALSVGDEAFQRKCFARINRIRDDGATVLFVSHSAGVVTQLCDRAVLLDAGELLVEGTPKFVVSRYHKMLYAPPDRVENIRNMISSEMEVESGFEVDNSEHMGASEIDKADALLVPENGSKPISRQHKEKADSRGWYDEGMLPKSTVRYETRGACIKEPRIDTPKGRRVNVLHAGDEYTYSYKVDFSTSAAGVRCGMLIKTLAGLELGGGATSLPHTSIDSVQAEQSMVVRFHFRCLLAEGVYFLNAGVLARIGEEETYIDRLIDACMFRVLPQPERLATGFVDFCISTEVPEIIKLVQAQES